MGFNQIFILMRSYKRYFSRISAVRIGPKLTETVKGKLKLGARILQVGGMEKVFKQKFSVREGENLLKASKCYISTTAGPIAGFLFISTDKIAFYSERSIKISSPSGEFIKIYYKVVYLALISMSMHVNISRNII